MKYKIVDVNLFYFVPEMKMAYKMFSLNLNCVLSGLARLSCAVCNFVFFRQFCYFPFLLYID